MPQLTSESSQRLESAGINAYAKARETYLKHSKASKDKSQTESKKDKEREAFQKSIQILSKTHQIC